MKRRRWEIEWHFDIWFWPRFHWMLGCVKYGDETNRRIGWYGNIGPLFIERFWE